MGVLTYLNDKLVNLVANLGTDRDKSTHNQFGTPILHELELINAYRGSWMARKIVDIPALDCTRKWRAWQADKPQIQAIEAEEKRLNVKQKVLEAMIKGRLFGGAAIYIGTDDRNPSLPLDPERMAKGGVKYLNVMTRRQLTITEIDQDPASPYFDKPVSYRVAGSTGLVIHPSRLVLFLGAQQPDNELLGGMEKGWGDSVLLASVDSIKQAESVNANVASLVFEAKVDVLGIPNFAENMENGGKEYENAVLSRLRLAAMGKGINGMIVRDAGETYDQKTAQFGTLPELMDRYDQKVCGSGDIPATRFMGQSPAGMSSTGESDIRNYYDRIQSMQELEVSPALSVLDECIIRSALGSRPEEIHYIWQSLWQPTATEKATIGKTVADTIKTLKDSALFNDDALSMAATTALVEGNVLPGLEAAIEEFGTEREPEEEEETAPAIGTPAAKITDAAPRPLYVKRDVLNGAAIVAWAKSQGFTSALADDDMHVTICYSKQPVDWMKMGDAWTGDANGNLVIAPGGARIIEKFDGGATVLLFNSSELSWRHRSMIEEGASWDYEDYQPHITISYDAGALDINAIEPYRGVIELGPEIFEALDEDWKTKVEEA